MSRRDLCVSRTFTPFPIHQYLSHCSALLSPSLTPYIYHYISCCCATTYIFILYLVVSIYILLILYTIYSGTSHLVPRAPSPLLYLVYAYMYTAISCHPISRTLLYLHHYILYRLYLVWFISTTTICSLGTSCPLRLAPHLVARAVCTNPATVLHAQQPRQLRTAPC